MAAKESQTPKPDEASLNETSQMNGMSDIANLTYEQARDELISIVAQLEGGQIGLEDSMSLWQRGEALAAHCSAWLDGAEAKLSAQPEQG